MGFADVHLTPLVDDGLGNSAYPLDSGDGRALAVDAARDLRGPRDAAERRGLTVAYAADTRPHADSVSGAVQLICSAPPGAERTIVIGAQKRTNPLPVAPDEDTFVRGERLVAGPEGDPR
ncbi:hypothetical protein [Actinomadura monticuli]|uniref:Uncharacterized protein n=1 Tax=Actinomadura monticuli TaxID=3097367 RepID=A0ABV4QHN1_9ACTN